MLSFRRAANLPAPPSRSESGPQGSFWASSRHPTLPFLGALPLHPSLSATQCLRTRPGLFFPTVPPPGKRSARPDGECPKAAGARDRSGTSRGREPPSMGRRWGPRKGRPCPVPPCRSGGDSRPRAPPPPDDKILFPLLPADGKSGLLKPRGAPVHGSAAPAHHAPPPVGPVGSAFAMGLPRALGTSSLRNQAPPDVPRCGLRTRLCFSEKAVILPK